LARFLEATSSPNIGPPFSAVTTSQKGSGGISPFPSKWLPVYCPSGCDACLARNCFSPRAFVFSLPLPKSQSHICLFIARTFPDSHMLYNIAVSAFHHYLSPSNSALLCVCRRLIANLILSLVYGPYICVNRPPHLPSPPRPS